jgi:hypothetical protein
MKIELANAMDVFPELTECKNETEARRRLTQLVEAVATKEYIERERRQPSSHFKYADKHYMIGDAIDGLKRLDKTVVSFADVDPPYAVDLTELRKREGKDSGLPLDSYNEIDKKVYPAFITSIATELYRILYENAWVVWWFAWEWYETIYQILKSVGFHVDRVPGIWDKCIPGPSPRADQMLGRSYEQFFVCRKGNPVLYKKGRGNMFSYKLEKVTEHPAEKPLTLIEELLDTFAGPSTIACIPFLGSGVDLRALYKKGLTGFGWELTDLYKDKFLAQVAKDIEEGLYNPSS